MTSPTDPAELSPVEELAVDIAAIQPRLYGFVLKRLADREQTLEVLQRTNLVLCRKASDFQQGSSFTAWAFTIAKFQVMAYRKSAGSNRLVFSDRVADLLERTPAVEASSVDERIPLLKRCMEKLNPSDLELVQRRYRDGVAIKPIAAEASKSVDAITMQLSRVRQQLAQCVKRNLNQETHYEI